MGGIKQSIQMVTNSTKAWLALAWLFIISLSGLAQIPLEIPNNPLIQDHPILRTALLNEEDQLYLGGSIMFVNDEITPPIIRINSDASLDPTFNAQLFYSNDLANTLTGPSALVDGHFLFRDDNNITVLNNQGELVDATGPLDGVFSSSFTSYKDSLLAVLNNTTVRLVDLDGNFREIFTDLSGNNFVQSVRVLSEDRLLIQLQDAITSDFEYRLFIDDGTGIDPDFTPFTVNQPGSVRHVELLNTGEIFIFGKNLEVNEVSGNGIFLINESGKIDENSIHEADLSFLDVFDNGVDFAIPTGDGRYFAVGRTDGSKSLWSLGRLLSTGARDDSFVLRELTIPLSFGSDFFLRTGDDFFLLFNQTDYDGESSSGVNKIDIDGNNDPEFTIKIGEPGFVRQFEKYDTDKYLMTGAFSETANSQTPDISAFTLDPEVEFPWLASVDLVEGDDIGGAARVLSNGEILLGVFDRSSSKVFQAYQQDGTTITLDMNNATSNFIEPPVSNIHESEDYIYATGIFRYFSNSQTQYSIIRMDKSYGIPEGFDPTAVASVNDRVFFSHLDDNERLTLQLTNFNEGTSEVTRLLPDGQKDDSFNDITLGDQSGFSRDQVYVLSDSRILLHDVDFNNEQIMKMYDADGTLLDEEVFTFSADGILSEVIEFGDDLLIVAGTFTSINGFPRSNLALIDFEGAVYDDLSLEVNGGIFSAALDNDILLFQGPGAVDEVNNGGFFGFELKTRPVEITSISNDEERDIIIEWDLDISIRTYEIFRTGPDDMEVLLATLEKGSTSFEDTDVEVNTNYTYRIVTSNFFGENNSEIEYQIIVPVAPTDLSVNYDNGNNVLTWNDNANNEIGYEIHRSIDNGTSTIIFTTEVDVTQYIDQSVDLNKSYSYFVVAISENADSAPSNTAIIDVFVPGSVTALAGVFDEVNNQISLAWELTDDLADNHLIFESVGGGDFSNIGEVSGSSTSYSRGISEAQTYRYYVVSKNEIGESQPSEQLELDILVLGIEDPLFVTKVYPNPSVGVVTVDLLSPEIDFLSIVDLGGRRILSTPVKNDLQIQISNLSPGIYLFNFLSVGRIISSERVVIDRSN